MITFSVDNKLKISYTTSSYIMSCFIILRILKSKTGYEDNDDIYTIFSNMTGVETDNAVFTHINPQECFDCDV
jgi:hypothetical protein